MSEDFDNHLIKTLDLDSDFFQEGVENALFSLFDDSDIVEEFSFEQETDEFEISNEEEV